MNKIRFILEKSRPDIDLTLYHVVYFSIPSRIYANKDNLPDEAKQFIQDNSPTTSQDKNIITKVYGDNSNYTYESIVRGYPWESR